MRTSSELYSTIGAIVISVTDFGLHCAVAIWLTMEYWGDHQPFWSFIVLALVANLIGIVAYIARNVGDDAGTGQPSEFSLKLQQRPNECVVVLICAIINTECLCFLTQSETAHTAFRKLDVLRTLLEGVPALFLELAFLYSRGYQGHVIVVVSFGWTIATIILKLLRVLIIVATGRCEREATLQFFKNTRLEDWILTPIYALHWFLLLLLMLFLDFAAFFPHFGQKWLSQQLLALGGYNASLALENTLTNDTRATPATFAALTALANAPSNETKWGMVYASCDVGQACPLAIDTLVSRVLLPAGLPTAESTALARLYLEPAAVDLLDEWGVVHSRLQTCFFVGVSFFVAGCLSSVVLLLLYLTRPAYAESFQTKLVARSSLTSAFIAAVALVNGSALNAISQDRLGYSRVKRDSALCSLVFFGLPMIGVAAAALAAFNCQHRSCSIGYKSANVEYYTLFAIVVTTPVVWWQFLCLLTATVAVRSASKDDKEALPTDPEELDALEPPSEDRGSWVGKLVTGASLLGSLGTWALQLLLLLAFFWNSPLATRTIGGRSAHEWGGEYAGEAVQAAIDLGADRNLTIAGEVDVTYFSVGVVLWVGGMLVNVIAVGVYMACGSTAVLRRDVEGRLALTAFAFTCASIHPEAMRILADRRADVMVIRKLGGLPALLLDVPLVVLCLHWLLEHGHNSFVLLAGCASLAHGLLFLSRAVVVSLTADLRRPPCPPDLAAGEPPFHRVTLGDALTLAASLLQYGLILALIGLYYHGWQYGGYMGFTSDNASTCQGAFYALCVMAGALLVANLGVSLSFLNHYEFSHEGLAERSYLSSTVLLLACFDVAWLNLLAEEAIATREVRRAAAFVSLAVLFLPALLLQASVVFMANVPMALLDERAIALSEMSSGMAGWNDFIMWHADDLMSASATQNSAFAFTVIIGVWKLLLLVILHTTSKNEPSPFKHTPVVCGAQWRTNRQPPDDFEEERRRTRRANSGRRINPRVEQRPTHHMGYALDVDGNYILDEEGGYTLGPGVRYVYDADGNYATDEYGNCVLEDADGVVIAEGYGEDGFGGFTTDGYGHGDNVTNTSRSTDTAGFAAGDAGGDGYGGGDAGVMPSALLWITCIERSVFTAPDGQVGIFVSLPPAADSPPYLFVQVHEQRAVKRSAFGKKEKQVKVSFVSVDVAEYGLGREYVEKHVSGEPQIAWSRVAGAAMQLEPDLDGGLVVDTWGDRGESAEQMEQQSRAPATAAVGRRGPPDRDAYAVQEPADDTAQRL